MVFILHIIVIVCLALNGSLLIIYLVILVVIYFVLIRFWLDSLSLLRHLSIFRFVIDFVAKNQLFALTDSHNAGLVTDIKQHKFGFTGFC